MKSWLVDTGLDSESYMVRTNEPTRIESSTPGAYRLAKKPDGTLVLQGAYLWQQGFYKSGHEWRDIPTVDLTPNV